MSVVQSEASLLLLTVSCCSVSRSLAPLYFSAQVLWLLIGFSSLGLLLTFCRLHLGLDVLQKISSALHRGGRRS